MRVTAYIKSKYVYTAHTNSTTYKRKGTVWPVRTGQTRVQSIPRYKKHSYPSIYTDSICKRERYSLAQAYRTNQAAWDRSMRTASHLSVTQPHTRLHAILKGYKGSNNVFRSTLTGQTRRMVA